MEYIVGLGEPHDPNSIQLYTKQRRRIRNSVRKPQNPVVMAEAVRMHTAAGGRTLRSAASEYNCMGMVFASRRTAIDIDELKMILEDDGFRRVDDKDATRGDVLVYFFEGLPSHVGIVWERNADLANAAWKMQVLSQWGAGGEYFHDAADVAYRLGTPGEFWTDRILKA